MSNEELAVMIQSGDRDKLLVLWRQIERFAYGWAIRWERALGEHAGVTVDDLMQAAFLALLDALERWEPECGAKFITYFGTCLKGAFTVACGMQTARLKQDPLRWAANLDAPADPSNPDGGSLGDLQPDPAAKAAMEAVDERDRLEKLHEALERALGTLPPHHADAVRGRYYRNESVDQRAHNAGLRALRHPSVSGELRQFLWD